MDLSRPSTPPAATRGPHPAAAPGGRAQLACTSEQFVVDAWRDSLVEARGHRPGSPYIEAVWLGVLGPSTVLAWRRLARQAATQPGTVNDSRDLARSLGLGDNLGRSGPLTRTLNRMAAFGIATLHDDTVAVRLALADVPQRQLARLSRSANLAHRYHSHRTATADPSALDAPVMAR